MAAIASADNDCLLSRVIIAILVFTGMHDATLKFIERRDVRSVCNAADAGGHDDVARAKLLFRAIPTAQRHSPSLRNRIIGSMHQFSLRPIVEFQRLYIGLEPIC